MSFELDCAKLTQRYLKETLDQDLTLEEIMLRPRWKRVWFWWRALEFYEGKPMPNINLDECKIIYGD